MSKLTLVALSLITFVSLISITPAEVKKQPREMVIRTNTKGQPQAVPKARNFNECVRGGMALGHPRIGPNGESDRRGAVGYCHSIGF